MIRQFKIFCKNTEEYIDIDGGDSLLDIYETMQTRLPINPICAKVNNKTENLSYPVFGPKMVEYLDASSKEGYRVYIRSLCMMLYKALHDLYPQRRLLVDLSIAGGYYCILKHESDQPLDPQLVEALKLRMKQLAEQDITFVRRERLTTDVIEMFRKQNMPDKVRLLENSGNLYTVFYKLGDVVDSYAGALAPSTGYIKNFDLIPYKNGMLLLGPDRKQPDKVTQPQPQEKLFKALEEHVEFNKIIRIADVGELNRVIRGQHVPLLINVAEALHNQKFAKMAADIADRYRQGGARVVMIAGPSSSGKTTSAKRLSIQLVTNYIIPKVISLDNYFVDRQHTPRDESGDYDYESLYALDLEQFNKDLQDLIDGKEVPMPTYNFETGQREYKGNTLKLEENNILLMEGIHGLNPDLTPQIDPAMKYLVYVSALTTLNIDDHNWISTSDNRLLRRIVRDFKYRGVNARSTIARWPSVRRGEEKWIFPFQENADAMFNSSLMFELAVMKEYAMPILKQVPVNAPEYGEAYRLMRFLDYFESIPQQDVPHTSLLREFLGGSSFTY